MDHVFTPPPPSTGESLLAAMAVPLDVMPPTEPRWSSRRRRIWELGSHAHCPVIGVCLPIAQVRKLMDKVLGGQTLANDYELHCGVNAECRTRNPVAEAVNKALDQRYERALREARALKTTEALTQWWQQGAASGHSLPGTLWATLTHPRCDTALEERVLQAVHMLQHQAGAADRADLARLEALTHENHVLGRELAAAQQRTTRQADTLNRRIEQQQAELMRLRAELMRRDTLLALAQEDLHSLEARVPELHSRQALSDQVAQQLERLQDLERNALRARHEAQRERHRADTLQAELERLRPPSPEAEALASTGAEVCVSVDALRRELAERSVLCVGGRQGSVPVYRQLIEQVGARFLHHDGGEEDHAARLDHTLASADLVICQTGCISHEAYWRVKDHCKRTGKRCVFVDKPSRASLQRALTHLGDAPLDASAPTFSSPHP
jgi:hypothetical protein